MDTINPGGSGSSTLAGWLLIGGLAVVAVFLIGSEFEKNKTAIFLIIGCSLLLFKGGWKAAVVFLAMLTLLGQISLASLRFW